MQYIHFTLKKFLPKMVKTTLIVHYTKKFVRDAQIRELLL